MCAGEIGWAHDDGFFHIHDLSHPNVGYCAGWSTEQLIKEGFNCGTKYVHSSPAHHLRTLCDQIVNFIFTMSGEWAGAQAFNALDTYCAAYIKYEGLTDDEIYDILESLVYGLNNKERVGMQSPFTNFSFDLCVPEDLKNVNCWIGEKQVDFTYGDCQEEMYRFNILFAKVMTHGDAAKKPFTFPIVTYSITPDFPWDSEIAEAIFTFADEMNSPYFSNFINSDQKPDDIRSMCCRLRLDLREMIKKSGGLFGAGDKTGSIGVVTLNLPKMAYIAKNRDFKLLERYDITIPENATERDLLPSH